MGESYIKGFSERPTVIVSLPVITGSYFPNPEKIILRIDRTSFDIGAYCYTQREQSSRRKAFAPHKVIINSLYPSRRNQIIKVVDYFSSMIIERGLRDETVSTVFKYFASYLNWADSEGYHDCLEANPNTRIMLEAWVLECEDKFKRGEWSASHTWANQQAIAALLAFTTENPGIHKGLRFLKTKSDNISTEPASERDFALVLAINETIFKGLSDLVLNFREYPYKLEMPVLPGWEANYLWVFPTHRWYLPPHLQGKSREKLKRPLWAFDYINGRIRNSDEIKHHYKMPCLAELSVRQADEAIKKANTDFRNFYRIQAARAAHDAFILLFVAHTGLNEAVIKNIQWENKFDTTAKQQGFKEVKWRASGKIVSALLRSQFLPLFNKYLKLRNYMLEGLFCEWLFIRGRTNFKEPEQITRGTIEKHYRLTKRIYPELPAISGRKLRATMNEWFSRNVEPAITARITGHTQETINKHYQAGTSAAQKDEMTQFLDQVLESSKALKRIRSTKDLIEGAISSPLGSCDKKGPPLAIDNDSPLKPSCREIESCLFCQRHVVKADEEDIRKLLSCSYVIEQVLLFSSGEQYFRPVLDIINEYLSDISGLLESNDLVDRIHDDVYKYGNLDPYWTQKLTLLDSIGILA